MKNTIDLLIAKLNDGIEICTDKNRPFFLGFLSDTEQDILTERIKKNKNIFYSFWGGSDNCERKYLGLFPYEYYVNDDFPIEAIKFIYNKNYKLQHKDFLGTILSQGLKREVVGDIIIEEGCTVVFVQKNISSIILSQVSKIGGIGVSLSVIDGSDITIEKHYETINRTITSMRLDCVVSSLTNVSRTKSALLIKSGKVFINGIEVYDNDKIINIGDKITIRGIGKFIYDNNDGATKKDRLKVVFKKYV